MTVSVIVERPSEDGQLRDQLGLLRNLRSSKPGNTEIRAIHSESRERYGSALLRMESSRA
jgi:hypothetical protein